MKTGDKIAFGAYDWLVLDARDGKALIITERIIEQRAYHDAYVPVTWEHCALRKYLCGEFYEKFTEAERRRICPALNENHDNQWYGTDAGAPTRDAVFLLSMEDAVCRYFGDSGRLLFDPKKNQRYWFERKDPNNARRVATLDGARASWWWTRTPGRAGVKAVYIHGDGNIGIQGNNILIGNLADGRCLGGVRPALWLAGST